MNKPCFLIALLLAAYLLTACATSSAPAPQWVSSMKDIYPESIYISGLGEGKTRQEAETKALAAISYFFVTQINSSISISETYTRRNGERSSEIRVIDNTAAETQTKLMAVRYSNEPWFNPRTKSWETVAYINREEGWRAFLPEAQRHSDKLLALINAADTQTEPFNAFLLYGSAREYANTEYNEVRMFAQILNTGRAQAFFRDTDSKLGQLTEKRIAARNKASVFVECPVDYNRIIYQSMVKVLGDIGFAVEQNRNAASTRSLVQVDEGMQSLDAGYHYNPALTVTISGARGALFSFKVQTGRQSALNQDLAKRRAYTALAEELEKSFAAELAKFQNALGR